MKPSEIYEQALEDIKSGKVDRDETEQFLIKSITKEVAMRQFMQGAKRGAFRPIALVIG